MAVRNAVKDKLELNVRVCLVWRKFSYCKILLIKNLLCRIWYSLEKNDKGAPMFAKASFGDFLNVK